MAIDGKRTAPAVLRWTDAVRDEELLSKVKGPHDVAQQYQLTWDHTVNRPRGNLLSQGVSRALSQAEVDEVLATMQWEAHGNYWVEVDGERCLIHLPAQVLEYWRQHREELGWTARQ
jgi:hypothetical protein